MGRVIVYFSTVETSLYVEYEKYFRESGAHLIQIARELAGNPEHYGHNPVYYRLHEAKRIAPGRKVLVHHRSLTVQAFGGFYRPLDDFVIRSVGLAGVARLLREFKDRQAVLMTSIGYYDGTRDHFSQAVEVGFLLPEPRGPHTGRRGVLARLYGHNRYPGQSLAELSDAQWQQYRNAASDREALEQLERWL